MDNNQNILKVSNLIMKFPIKSDFIFKKKMFLSAVDNVSFNLKQGDSIGIVGESGSGKTTVGRIISRLLRPTSGSIVFEGKEVSNITGKELKMFMPNIQTVFQDPYTSLNPKLTIGEIISEPMKINNWGSKNKINKRTKHLIDLVGLPQASIYRYPSDFSGGQRQRIAICRAIAINPKIVICDEAVSALDVSMQAKILNLLVDLKNDLKLTYIFISHDLSVVRMICDKIIVMYMGKIVETSPSEKFFNKQYHPYAEALIESIPDPYSVKGFSSLKGEIENNINLPVGCNFQNRCKYVQEACKKNSPNLREIEKNRFATCFKYNDFQNDNLINKKEEYELNKKNV